MTIRGPYETKTREGGPQTIGDRLRVLRIRTGRTQAQVAEDLHTDQAQVSAWERDKARPSKAILGALATYYRIELDALDTGSGFLALLNELEESPEPAAAQPWGTLPDPGPGGVLLLDRPKGEHRTLDSIEALRLLVEAMQDGRKVWIVLD